MEVDDEGCCASTGKSPPKGSTKVPVPPVPDSPLTTQALTSTLTMAPTTTKEALHCQKILDAEKDLAHAKVKYDAALGFINLANIICDYELVDKMSTSKMTMEAFHLAEAAYKKTLKQLRGGDAPSSLRRGVNKIRPREKRGRNSFQRKSPRESPLPVW
ncbi:hypothetical protein CDAR_547711 [Caerostris darwini]|uniref:Uncharacterized protein n=1 Tax=Caerostris darwini TaxID=1538125 RepID=A0AAV4WE87_9ARAC|nr:hypothetical protein CDAR_547711 [Caerostris darwini]